MKSPSRDRAASTTSIRTYVMPENERESELNDCVLQKLLTQLSTLYSTKNPKVQKTIIAKEYSREPEFEDNLVKVTGRENLYSQFRAVSKLFHSYQHKVQKFKITAPNIIEFDNTHVFSISERVRSFTLNVKTYLQLELVDDGRRWVIIKHKDVWTDVWILNLIPFYQRFGKGITGGLTSFIFKLAL
jgi:hypothetical protein